MFGVGRGRQGANAQVVDEKGRGEEATVGLVLLVVGARNLFGRWSRPARLRRSSVWRSYAWRSREDVAWMKPHRRRKK